jgi:hypothetical protein
MIFALIALGVACVLYFFVIQPGLDRLSDLETEAIQAEETQDKYSAALAAAPAAAEQLAAATTAYDAARAQIFSPMSIEALDSTTTGYLESAGFAPGTLSMSQLQPEVLPPFSPQPLSDSPVPVESADTQPAASEETADGTAADGSLYSYSASISAVGGWDNLYNLLDILANTSGVELTQYTYSEGSGDKSDNGSFSMTIKFYVYIEGTADEAADTPVE